MKTLCAVIGLSLILAPGTSGLPAYYDAFTSRYSSLNTCAACHVGSDPASNISHIPRNSYGQSFAGQPHAFDNASLNNTALANIEGSDSDGDGVSNLVEIQHGTFPGDASSKPDVVAPSVSINSPGNNSTFTSAQTVTIEASASDDVGVTRVEFFKDASSQGSDFTSPYRFDWTVSSSDNGSHTWLARAFDSSGNSADSSVTLNVNIDVTPPAVLITSPVNSSSYTSPQTVTIQADAIDNAGVARVEFYKDGGLQSSDNSSPYSFDWNVSGSDNGSHTWLARAFDSSGNSADSSITLNVNIDVTPPSVSITSPANNSSYTSPQMVTIQADAIDNAGVARVEFYKDGGLQSSDNSSPYSFDWNVSGSDNGSHTWLARAFDTSGNSADSSVTLSVNIDVTPPSVSITSPANNSSYTSPQTVTIQATASDNAGVARVEFYKDGGLQSSDNSSPYSFDWNVSGSDNGSHTWLARAFDTSGNSADSSVTLSVNIDVTPPSVSITSPANNSSYTSPQAVTIQATASDNAGVARVEFYKDGGLQSSDNSSPYSFDWNVTGSDNGSHTWLARAFDTSGNSADSSITLNVNIDVTPPSVSITSPANNSSYTSPQTVTIQATASDNAGVARVEFYKDGGLQSSDNSSPYSFDWNVSGSDNGSHTWLARAFDTSGNSADSSVTLSVNIDVTPPSVSITSPANNSSYTSPQTVTIQATASDNAGVARVEFYKDGGLQSSDNSSPYSFDWNVTGSDNGSHTWLARAFDTSGNSADLSVTLSVNIDVTPPSVSITSPANNSSYTSPQTVTIQATASDNAGVARVEFYKDGGLQSSDNSSPYSFDWNVSGSDNGSHTWLARAFDSSGNSADSSVTLNVNIDVTPPSVSITSPGNNSSVGPGQSVPIQVFASDNVKINRVEFYKDGALQGTDQVAPYSFEWTVNSSELGTHTWLARAFDDRSNSAEASVTLIVADLTPPNITITSPANNSSFGIGLTVTIVAAASDNVSVSKVEFFKDEVLQSTDTSTPYSFDWITAGADRGSHAWRMRAFDSAGNSADSSITLTVADSSTPSISITAPADHSSFAAGQTVTLQATATDDGGVARVEFFRDGTLQGSDTSSPYSFDWNISGTDVGSHTWLARAVDAAGNSADATVTLTVADSVPPQVAIVSPSSGTLFDSPQTAAIQVTASDNVGVTKVEFYKNGILQTTDATAPFAFEWSITAAENGNSQWTARAFDASGNAQTSSPIDLTVRIQTVDTTPPQVAITSPATSSVFNASQTVDIRASATDNVGIGRIEFYRDETLQGTDTTAPYTFAWTVNSAVNGLYTWTAVAYDTTGNSTKSAPIQLRVAVVEVDDQPPAVMLTFPANQSTFTSPQNVVIQAEASDNVGVTRVEFFDNGELQGSDTGAPFRFDWTFTAADNGAHIWTARAYDAAGNAQNSGGLRVLVLIEQPNLAARRNGGSLTLTWSSTDPGLVLQQSPSLDGPWEAVPIGPLAAGGAQSVTVPISNPFVQLVRRGKQLQLEWPGNATLQRAPSMQGPWVDVLGATSPAVIDSTAASAFYRLRGLRQTFYRLHHP